MSTPAYKVMDLVPPIHKHTFTPEVDPSNLIGDEAEFRTLRGIDWSTPNFQTAEEDEEPKKDDPEGSSRQGQDEWSAGRFIYLILWKHLILFGSRGHVIG